MIFQLTQTPILIATKITKIRQAILSVFGLFSVLSCSFILFFFKLNIERKEKKLVAYLKLSIIKQPCDDYTMSHLEQRLSSSTLLYIVVNNKFYSLSPTYI